MTIAFLDCFSGIAGDMVLGALVDAGLNPEVLHDTVSRFDLEGVEVRVERSWRSGLAGTKVDVVMDDSVPQPHRGLSDVTKLIEDAKLDDGVRQKAIAVFTEIARAEAHVHGCTPDEVHFHEVGAIDAIVDIVGACAGFDALGVTEIHTSEVLLGKGFTHAAHGRIPVPVMATMEILKGVPVQLTDRQGELVTPTGAALLKVLSAHVGRGVSFTPTSIGYGFGTVERENPPNALRIILGKRDTKEAQSVVALEANVDDCSPQVLGYVNESLMAAGALDVYIIPLVMKKSRPGHLIGVLCDQSRADELTDRLLVETSTLGVRRHRVDRSVLPRRIETRETSLGSIRFKVRPDGKAFPEYEDVASVARETGKPLRELMDRLLRESEA